MEYTGDYNFARMCGELSSELVADHEMQGETIYRGKLSVLRSSGAVDALPLSVPGRLMDGEALAGNVSLRAQIRSYNLFTDGASRLIITLFARSIAPAPPDAPHLNDVAITGTLCKRAVFRTTPFMREIADLLIAVNRAYGKADYIPAIAWGNDAHLAAELPVGCRIRAEGRLQSRTYLKRLPDGGEEERVAFELSCRALAPLK